MLSYRVTGGIMSEETDLYNAAPYVCRRGHVDPPMFLNTTNGRSSCDICRRESRSRNARAYASIHDAFMARAVREYKRTHIPTQWELHQAAVRKRRSRKRALAARAARAKLVSGGQAHDPLD